MAGERTTRKWRTSEIRLLGTDLWMVKLTRTGIHQRAIHVTGPVKAIEIPTTSASLDFWLDRSKIDLLGMNTAEWRKAMRVHARITKPPGN